MLVHLLVPYTIMGSGLMTFIINVTCSIIITKYHTVAAIDRQNIIKESYYNFDFNKAIFINIHYNFISYIVYWDIPYSPPFHFRPFQLHQKWETLMLGKFFCFIHLIIILKFKTGRNSLHMCKGKNNMGRK